MIEFKDNIKEILPYDREQYINFLEDDFESSVEWCGVSFQMQSKGKEMSLPQFVENYESLFKKVILKFDDSSLWIINHSDKDLNWLPNEEDNLILLRSLFKQCNIPNTFRGALIFMKEDLLKFSRDLISYPSAVYNEDGLLYKDLDISHSELQFIIKISGHRNIDFLSTNKEFLRQVVNENSLGIFNIKLYRGTSL